MRRLLGRVVRRQVISAISIRTASPSFSLRCVGGGCTGIVAWTFDSLNVDIHLVEILQDLVDFVARYQVILEGIFQPTDLIEREI